MLKDPFYSDERSVSDIADQLLEVCRPGQQPRGEHPPAKGKHAATAGIFLPGGAKKAWEAGTKWPGKGRLTGPATLKAAEAQAQLRAKEGPTANAIWVDKRTGQASYRHADGRMSPRAL
jgi:hypothetical protein